MDKYDGWAVRPNGMSRKLLVDSFHWHRRDTLKWRDDNCFPSREWFRETGSKSSKHDYYKIIKVRLVEVE